MEFLPNNTVPPPKNLYPCLATITITPSTTDRTRRQSTTSSTGGDDDNVLKRIASGGRRKSDASARRKSLVAGSGSVVGDSAIGGQGAGVGFKDKGTWYWRVQAGVTDSALILLPLTQPANPLLTTHPAPLSEAMPAHSASAHGQSSDNQEGLVDKMKNLFRRSSTTTDKAVPHPDPATTQSGDKVIDQTAGGEQLPSAKANAVGATNLNANAETGWPGFIDGQKLGMVAVPLNAIEKNKVGHSGGKKGEAYYITIPVASQFAAMIAGYTDSGSNIKTGTIRLEFDKDWIGAKAESEILYNNLTTILSEDRAPPSPTQLQLGSTGGAGTSRQHDYVGGTDSSLPNSGMGDRHITRRNSQVAPDISRSAAVAGVESESGSGRKVAGDV